MKSIFFIVVLGLGLSSWAVEVAPRITDREIIVALTELKAEVKAGKQLMLQRFEASDQRFDQIQASMDQRFEAVDKRFAQSDIQMGRLHSTMLSVFSVLGALIIALFGYVVWDRRTALKPLEERFNQLEKDLVYDLQLRNENGSLLTRFIQAMRELAQEDANVAKVLKTFSLL